MTRQQYIDTLVHLLKIQSISTQEQYLPEMEKARHLLRDMFLEMVFKVKFLKGSKHAAVFAERIENTKLPTILVYGHYDVQPPDPLDEWKTDPFEPKIIKDKIYARGATDDKGQFMVHIMAVKSLLAKNKGKLPVNFKFFIEGEEEIGSISIPEITRKYKKELKANHVIVSDSEMVSLGQPAIDISLRGLVYTEVFIETAKQDLHSGQFGGVAENPANVLAHIIAELKDNKGRVCIPKFYDHVLPPTQVELKDYKALGTTPKQLSKEAKSYGIGGGENWYSLNERRWSRPTLDVNGIVSGYMGEGSKTIIPARASAKISMRLVTNQDPAKIYREFEKFVKSLVPKTVKIRVIQHADALPYKSSTTDPIFDILKDSLKKSFGKPAVFQGVGGSIGFVPITASLLKVPVLMVGFGLPDENLHSPNEHFSVDNYLKGIEAMTDFYTKLEYSKIDSQDL